MRFATYILRNMIGRKARTALTVLGLAVGIAAVMVLTGIAWGFERSFQAIYPAKGVDLIVVRAGIGNQLSSNLDVNLADTIRKVEGVRELAPSLMDTVSFEDANLVAVLASGWEPESILFRGVRLLEGRSLIKGDSNVALLGRVLALNLGKKSGDTMAIAGEPFQVVGIFETESLFENGGLIVPISELQKMMGRVGQVTGFVVSATDSGDAAGLKALGKRIESQVPGIAALPTRDYISADLQIRLSKSMAWATMAVALVLGSVGMLNTMVMAVFERTGEIGLLRALGWRRSRILTLILGEAIGLGLLSVIVGSMFAWVGVRLLLLSPNARGFIDPQLPPEVFAMGLAMGAALSLLGGLYPALRAASLEPTEALRHD